MAEYINEFSRQERIHFRHSISPRKTVCRVFVCVKTTSRDETFKSTSTSSNKGHAELIGLLNITNGLIKYLHQTNKAEIIEFDLVIRLNNSPCHLECQSFIKYWIQHVILGLIPKVIFRFSLYLSKFYIEKDVPTIETLKDWALELAKLGITVFFCPMIISQMIPCKRIILKRVIKSDKDLISNYFALLTEFPELHTVDISYSQGFGIRTEDICLKTFASEPQYIRISPPDIDHDLPYSMKIQKITK